MLNWVPLPAAVVTETIFRELDDEHALADVDLAAFTSVFQQQNRLPANRPTTTLVDETSSPHGRTETVSRAPKVPSVLEPNKARNLAIALRRVPLSVEACAKAIADVDTKVINPELAEMLLAEFVIPSEDLARIASRAAAGDKLADTDEFVFRLSKVERCAPRLELLRRLDVTPESLRAIGAQADFVTAACQALMTSERLKQVLELVLALGNYLNGQRRGLAYGFRLNVLDRLREHRSADKSQTLLHFLAATVAQSRPEAADFADDLVCVDKAGHVSLAALQLDLRQSRAALAAAAQELALNPHNAVLRAYTASLAPELDAVDAAVAEAGLMYSRCARFYCEDEKTDPATFFGVFTRFAAEFQNAGKENRARARKAAAPPVAPKPAAKSPAAGRADGTRPGLRREVGDGVIDDLIHEMRSRAFRRAEQSVDGNQQR